jgi:predicted phage tail protein
VVSRTLYFSAKKTSVSKTCKSQQAMKAIRIAPVLQGAKSGGWFQVILGAALVIGAGFLTGGTAFAALGAGGVGGFVASVGASMFLGVIQLLSPQQTTQSGGAQTMGLHTTSAAL